MGWYIPEVQEKWTGESCEATSIRTKRSEGTVLNIRSKEVGNSEESE